MSKGKINLQAADGAVIGLIVPDGLTSGERQISLGVNLSGIAAYHLLQGNLAATINANYVEASATTTRNYTTSDYIFDSLNNKLYDCILASTAGALLTNTTYFTSITAGTISINNALIPLAQGIDLNGSNNTILSKNETITGLTYTQGKNYVYCDKNGSYGVKNVAPVYTDTFSTETMGGVLKGDEFHITQNKWQTIANNPRGDLANPSLVNVFGDGSCKALYRFEGNANDESSTYNGTATNVVYGSSSFIGQSAVIPTGAVFKSAIDMNTTVTVSGWINLKNDVANGMIWAFGGDSGANSILLFCNGNGKYHLTQASYIGGILVSVNKIQLNTWVHISTVITSTEYKLYINGVLDSVYNPTSAMGNLNIGFSIGGLYNSMYVASSLIADQVRVFDRALSEAEVKSLYSLYSYTYDKTNSRNYLNHIVHADNDGGVLYVEELPKIEYKDIVKANEFKGKNACTMWAILDCTTTPITIKDSYNVAYVIRLGTGDIEIMPLDLDISKVTVIPGGHASETPGYSGLTFGAGVYNGKIRVTSRYYNNSAINLPELSINVYGGKN